MSARSEDVAPADVAPAGFEATGIDAGGVAVTTTLRAKPGRERALEAVLCRIAATVRREEPGCLLYQPARSPHDPLRFVVLERYRDTAALAAHANAEYLRETLPGLMECLESPPELAVFGELTEGEEGERGAAGRSRSA